MRPQDVARRLPVLLLAGTLLLSISACGKEQDTTAENEDYNISIVEMSETPETEEPSVSVAESTAEPLASEETDEEESENEESEPPQDEVIPSEETVSETTENLESSEEAESEPVSAEPIVSEEVISPSPSVSYTYTDLSKTAYTTTALNVRSGPSTGFDKIGGYSNGAEISVTGQCNETGWYRVDYNGNIGYCDSSYTTDTKPVVQSSTPSNNTSNNNTDSSSASNNNNTSSATQYNVVSAGDSGASAYYVGLIQNGFNSLPQWVQTSFVNHGWQIKARSGYWWTEFGWNMSLKGLTVEDYKTIYISARDDSANYHIVAHEVGHYVDWLYGWPSHSSEFNGIYNSEYKQFCNYYSYSNGYPGVEELFAEGMYHYWTDPGVLSSVAPKTYAFIQRTL